MTIAAAPSPSRRDDDNVRGRLAVQRRDDEKEVSHLSPARNVTGASSLRQRSGGSAARVALLVTAAAQPRPSIPIVAAPVRLSPAIPTARHSPTSRALYTRRQQKDDAHDSDSSGVGWGGSEHVGRRTWVADALVRYCRSMAPSPGFLCGLCGRLVALSSPAHEQGLRMLALHVAHEHKAPVRSACSSQRIYVPAASSAGDRSAHGARSSRTVNYAVAPTALVGGVARLAADTAQSSPPILMQSSLTLLGRASAGAQCAAPQVADVASIPFTTLPMDVAANAIDDDIDDSAARDVADWLALCHTRVVSAWATVPVGPAATGRDENAIAATMWDPTVVGTAISASAATRVCDVSFGSLKAVGSSDASWGGELGVTNAKAQLTLLAQSSDSTNEQRPSLVGTKRPRYAVDYKRLRGPRSRHRPRTARARRRDDHASSDDEDSDDGNDRVDESEDISSDDSSTSSFVESDDESDESDSTDDSHISRVSSCSSDKRGNRPVKPNSRKRLVREDSKRRMETGRRDRSSTSCSSSREESTRRSAVAAHRLRPKLHHHALVKRDHDSIDSDNDYVREVPVPKSPFRSTAVNGRLGSDGDEDAARPSAPAALLTEDDIRRVRAARLDALVARTSAILERLRTAMAAAARAEVDAEHASAAVTAATQRTATANSTIVASTNVSVTGNTPCEFFADTGNGVVLLHQPQAIEPQSQLLRVLSSPPRISTIRTMGSTPVSNGVGCEQGLPCADAAASSTTSTAITSLHTLVPHAADTVRLNSSPSPRSTRTFMSSDSAIASRLTTKPSSPSVAAHAATPFVQPRLVTGATLRSYQLAGVRWLASLHSARLNGILADEMGLVSCCR